MAEAGLEIRADLRESQRAVLESLRRPGPHLRGAERIALASASRRAADCPLCRARRAGDAEAQREHARSAGERLLSPPLLELAHRLRADPGRVSADWHRGLLGAGLTPGAYVEAVGVVSLVAGLDAFCRAVGLPPYPLPAPIAGAPSGRVPAGLSTGRGWVPMLRPEDAGGPEADLYPPGPRVPNIVRALSLVPDHVRSLLALMGTHYLGPARMFDPSAERALDRLQIELVAARVSARNECFY